MRVVRKGLAVFIGGRASAGDSLGLRRDGMSRMDAAPVVPQRDAVITGRKAAMEQKSGLSL